MNAQTDFILTYKYGRYPMNKVSFSDIAVVSCGTLSLELNHLKKEGFFKYQSPVFHDTRAT
jgi:hypothetical protein